ncbi:MAG: hypothetical protein ACLPKE_08660 [Streptosporangiaceae bacterium]
MSVLATAWGAAPGPVPGEFDVEYIAEDGARHKVPLADAARVRLADASPARRLKARKGQRHLPGRWWLFPGQRVGQPLTPGALRQQLQAFGIPTTQARASAFRQLVLQAPAPIVA